MVEELRQAEDQKKALACAMTALYELPGRSSSAGPESDVGQASAAGWGYKCEPVNPEHIPAAYPAAPALLHHRLSDPAAMLASGYHPAPLHFYTP